MCIRKLMSVLYLNNWLLKYKSSSHIKTAQLARPGISISVLSQKKQSYPEVRWISEVHLSTVLQNGTVCPLMHHALDKVLHNKTATRESNLTWHLKMFLWQTYSISNWCVSLSGAIWVSRNSPIGFPEYIFCWSLNRCCYSNARWKKGSSALPVKC